jgi:hypothetical protein
MNSNSKIREKTAQGVLAPDEKIDVSLEHTFPASDPPAIGSNRTLEERLRRHAKAEEAAEGQRRRQAKG